MTALLLAALLAAPLDQRWTFDAGAAPDVEVSNISGRIEVERGGASVEVRASAAEAGDFTVRATQEGKTVTVAIECAHGRRRNCREGGRIDLQLKVPAGASLSAANVSGPIRVSGVEGRQSLSEVSGRIESEGSAAPLHVNTVSGAIRLAPRAMADVQVNSVSGQVRLALPRGAGATVSLSTLSGRIRGPGGRGGASERVYGDGSARVAVSSISGSVEIEER